MNRERYFLRYKSLLLPLFMENGLLIHRPTHNFPANLISR